MSEVAVVAYGAGNVASVQFALERLGASVRLTDDPAVVADAERVILPGVGAAGYAMTRLAELGLIEPLRAFSRPLLGVCLGHQCIGAVYGAPVHHAPELLHGKTSMVQHDDTGVLAGLPSPFVATRYHSLAVAEDELPAQIAVTGRTTGGVVMALRHTELPIDGVQFHPESVLTEHGHRIVANWLARVGVPDALDRADDPDVELGAVRADAHFAAT